jgi:antitoxin HicB
MSLVNKMKAIQKSKTVEDYLKLPYTIEIFRDETDGNAGWVARVIELPGCITQGDTIGDLAEMIEDAMRTWIETALADGDPVPEPRQLTDYSGKFVTRVPRSLHQELVHAAGREGVSLNAYVMMALTKAVTQTNSN